MQVKNLLYSVILLTLVFMVLVSSGQKLQTVPQHAAGIKTIPAASSISGSYLGMNVDMMNMVPGSAYTIKTSSGGDFFDQASQLGINTIRIVETLFGVIGTGPEYSQAQWQQVFTRAQQTHIHIILLTGGLSHEQLLLTTFGLAKSPALWMIDVENEPDVCGSLSGLQQEINYAHQAAPGIPVTIGGWKCGNNWQIPSDLAKIVNLVDIVSPHKYQFTTALKNGTDPQTYAKQELTAIRQYAQGKPIFLEEFGANNGMGSTGNDATGTPQTQSQIYQGVYKEIVLERSQNVLGATGWSYSTRKTFAPEDSDLPWAIVLNNGQQLLPATQVFASYANTTPVPVTVTVQPTQPPVTGGPTPTLQPTGSTNGTKLSFTVCPHGLGNCGDNVNLASGGNTNPLHLSRNTTVTVLNASNQPVSTNQGTVAYNTSSKNFQGSINLNSISNGQYLVTIKMDGLLPKQVPGIITVTNNQTTTLPSISLVTGDINNDNQLDILDYNIIVGCFGSKQSTSSCTNPPSSQSPGADINDDGTVDGIDYNLFLRELSVQKGG